MTHENQILKNVKLSYYMASLHLCPLFCSIGLAFFTHELAPLVHTRKKVMYLVRT